MALWMRFRHAGETGFGTVEGDHVAVHQGDLFANPAPTGRSIALADLEWLPPCVPGKMPALWNNFHERAAKEGNPLPAHPLYFLKSPNSFIGHGATIARPASFDGKVIFEAELGIVIGQRVSCIDAADASAAIFGYTCVNDVTARDLMRLDPAFVHWTRAKSFDSFGPFGPVIATGLDPAGLRVRAIVAGRELQNYAVSDMFFSPAEIVSHISHDMTLEPGDVIACGTSVGAGPLADGDTVEVAIDGVGRLVNRFV